MIKHEPFYEALAVSHNVEALAKKGFLNSNVQPLHNAK